MSGGHESRTDHLPHGRPPGPSRRPTSSHTARPSDNILRENRNVFAVMTLFAGICSWVPLVIVVAFPLTVVAAILSLLTVWRKKSRRGFGATIFGLSLAFTAVLTHLLVASLGGIVGIVGNWLGF